MSYKRLDTLGDAVRYGVMVEIACANAACGRVRVIPPFDLLRSFTAASTPARIGPRLVCIGADLAGGGCGQRGARVRFTLTDPSNPDPPEGGGNVVAFPARRFPRPLSPVAKPARRAARGRRGAQAKRSHLKSP